MEENVEIKNSNIFDEPVLLNTPLSDQVESFALEDNNDEIDDFLAIEMSSNFEEGYVNSEGDITFLDNLFSDDDSYNLVSKVITNHEPEQIGSSVTFYPRSDPLHHEFASEPLPLPARNDREFEEYLSLVTVLCEISTSQSERNVHANQTSVIESLLVSPTPIEDSESTEEEINIFLVQDDLISPGVENDDSEDEVNELPNLDHQDDPLIPRPPPEPPDVEKCFEPEAITNEVTRYIKIIRIQSKRHENQKEYKKKPKNQSRSQKSHAFSKIIVSMVDANINAPGVPVAAASLPTHSEEQILPHNKWVPVGKTFIASSTIPPIYIQQFWDSIRFDKDKGYSYQLDEQCFYLTKATLRDALQLPQDNNNFTPSLNANTIISFVNELGYPNVVRTLSGVVTNDMENIDYAKRIWEEFTQCIHSFIEDKMNLALRTEGKKKVNPLVILSVHFTKLIINHLQSIHKFYKRPGSPLHLPYKVSALGYLKFSFKSTKRVRFGMVISDTLISENIQSATYYPEYVAKVAKYQRYLAREVVSDDKAPAPKPTKGAKPKTPRKPKPQSTISQPPKTKPAPAKPHEKKRKLVMDTTEAPSPAKRSKAGKVGKKRTRKSSQQLVDEFIDEGVPADEPRFEDEEADIMQKIMEESLKDAYPAPLGPLPPVVIKEPEPGKFQLLPKVQGKGKDKVSEEQAGQVLLNLQTQKKKNLAKQFIFQRGTPATAEPSEAQKEGQGGTNPGDAGMSQTPSSHVVHARPNLDHMDLGIAEAPSQPNTEKMDEELTVTTYLKVQENLKLPTEGDVRLEEPASSVATLSSLQNLDKEISLTNQFLAEKSQEDEPKKTNTEAEVQSIIMVPIHQDTSSVPLMTILVIDLTIFQPAFITVQASLPPSTATKAITTTTLPPLPPQPQQGISNSIII
ncbi:hypothetical protein Tco_0475890 [Tanacetum coccineum]